MKKLHMNFLATAFLSLGLLAFTFVREGGLKGTVVPAEGAAQIVAISGTDTLQAAISGGGFALSNVKKGTYTIWVKAKAPYRDTSVENVAVLDSTVTDVGEIKLQQ